MCHVLGQHILHLMNWQNKRCLFHISQRFLWIWFRLYGSQLLSLWSDSRALEEWPTSWEQGLHSERVLPRCSGSCAERERDRERLLLLPLPRVWPSSKQKSMQPGVNGTSNLIPVRLYHLKNRHWNRTERNNSGSNSDTFNDCINDIYFLELT